MRTDFRMQRTTCLKLATLVFILLHCAVAGHSKTKSSDKEKAYVDQFTDPVRLVSLDDKEREEIANIAKETPAIDLEIPFGVDTAILSVEAKKNVVDPLGRAITNPDMAGSTFLIGGFTDGLESEAYSQSLSERRAEAVKQELMTSFSVPAENLVTVGYGSSKLKNAGNPFDPVNNMVQVLNMGTKTAK